MFLLLTSKHKAEKTVDNSRTVLTTYGKKKIERQEFNFIFTTAEAMRKAISQEETGWLGIIYIAPLSLLK